jgi:hypothetical protein
MLTRKNRNRYEWKPVQRKIIFTYIQNIDSNTLLQIKDDDILIKTCFLNKYTQSLCNNYFWELKIRQLLPEFEFPMEYNNKGKELYLIMKNINIFEKEQIYKFDSYYYQMFYHDDDGRVIYYDLTRQNVSIANWSVMHRKSGLLKSMLDLGIHPDKNYIDDSYNDYDIIRTLVDYINNNDFDIEQQHKLLPNSDNVLSLPNTGTPEIIELLLPFNIVNIHDLLEMIFLLIDFESLKMIMDNKIYLSQQTINLGFIEDDVPFITTKILIDNKMYPDTETIYKLPKMQQIYMEKLMLK